MIIPSDLNEKQLEELFLESNKIIAEAIADGVYSPFELKKVLDDTRRESKYLGSNLPELNKRDELAMQMHIMCANSPEDVQNEIQDYAVSMVQESEVK